MMRIKVISRMALPIVCTMLLSKLSAQTSIGIAILNSSMGNDPRNVVFSNISWPNPDSAAATELDGTKVIFDQAEITKIIYFDHSYFEAMNDDTRISGNRAGMQFREEVIQTRFLNVASDLGCGRVQASLDRLKGVEDRFPATISDLEPVLVALEGIISNYKSGLREVRGTWISQADFESQNSPTAKPNPVVEPKISFTTKDGRHFEGVTVSMGEKGLDVRAPDGDVTVPIEQLPDDLSKFPEDIQKNIASRHIAAEIKQREEATGLPAYMAKVKRAIGVIWYPKMRNGSTPRGIVKLRFTIHSNGTVDIFPDSNDASTAVLRSISIESIKEAAPFDPFPDSVRSAYGDTCSDAFTFQVY